LVDRSFIRVKAMLVAPNQDLTGHAVSLGRPTVENPDGYHRLIGGGIDLGETHQAAIVREVDEELGATIHDLTFLATVENIFRIDGVLGHEVVFLYSGRLEPQPAVSGATLTESDGSIVPVVWRPFDDVGESLPLYPAGVVPWIRRLADGR
jgi:ADP-ribose pyrophosphatase YjhB (NUDIX family)